MGKTRNAFLALLLLTASVFAAAGALDGKSYQGQFVEKGKTKGDADTFLFKDGTFRSTACDKYGFKEAAYTGDATHFEATTRSDKGVTMAWKGTVAGDTVEGTVVQTKATGTPKEYWFKGTIKR